MIRPDRRGLPDGLSERRGTTFEPTPILEKNNLQKIRTIRIIKFFWTIPLEKAKKYAANHWVYDATNYTDLSSAIRRLDVAFAT